MALGDLMVSRLSQSSVTVVTNHLYDDDDNCASSAHDDSRVSIIASPRVASSSYENLSAATSMAYLPQTLVLCDLRHDDASDIVQPPRWRLKERVSFSSQSILLPLDCVLFLLTLFQWQMKTGCVALVMCLHITVDPPDVIKISPCARLECWIGPNFHLTLIFFFFYFNVSRNHFSLLLF